MMKTLFVQRKERQKEFFLDEEHALIFKNNKREKLHFSKLYKIKIGFAYNGNRKLRRFKSQR